MKIDFSDDFIERIKQHLKETGNMQPVDFFIEEAVDKCIENYPWFTHFIVRKSNHYF